MPALLRTVSGKRKSESDCKWSDTWIYWPAPNPLFLFQQHSSLPNHYYSPVEVECQVISGNEAGDRCWDSAPQSRLLWELISATACRARIGWSNGRDRESNIQEHRRIPRLTPYSHPVHQFLRHPSVLLQSGNPLLAPCIAFSISY